MAADPMLSLTTQPEKPNHYTYLKEFRVEQCQSFLQHKCNQHRPFICFNWHFMNQRRRRPVRKRDGTFNYSADNYCAKYDETTGICPDGDECPFLHRTAGDTERRYHLRYYKTCMCVHDTDTRGYCVKNGHHCAFAHGAHDQRPPVFDIKEIEASQQVDGGLGGGAGGGGIGCGGVGNSGLGMSGCGMGGGDLLSSAPNALDKERNLMNEDPKWQDTNYVLANYKTEPCKRPPRLCRQGYACPQYHNSKDKRRSPRKFKYRSTPCPNVKHGEEWGEPANCEAGDNCQYCHTRTEQQFHPEIYKSTKCNDVQQAGYCPRSVFCAFAHVEPYIMSEESNMDGGNGSGSSAHMAIGDLLGNVMHMDNGIGGNNSAGCIGSGNIKKDRYAMMGSGDGGGLQLVQNGGSGESCESASTSSVGSNQSHSKAPGAQLQHNKQMHMHQQQQQQQHHHQQQHHQQQQQQQQHHQQHHLFQNSLNNNHNNGGGGNGGNLNMSNNNNGNGNIGNGLLNAVAGSGALQSFPDFTSDLTKQLMVIDNDVVMSAMEKEQRKRMCLTFSMQDKFVGGGGGVNNGCMNELAVGLRRDFGTGLDSNGMSSGLLQQHQQQQQQQQQQQHQNAATQPMNIPSQSQLSDSLSGFLQGNSAPSNIPDNFSPNMFSNHFGTHIGGSAPKMHNSFGGSGVGNGGGGNNGSGGVSGLHADNNSLFFQPHISDALAISPELGFTNHTLNGIGDMQHQRLRDELTLGQTALKMNWDDRILQASKACEAWRSEADESNRKAVLAEQQRDSAISHVQLVTEKLGQLGGGADHLNGVGNAALPRDLRIQGLKGLQAKLRSDLEEVEKMLYMETANLCMKCEENSRSVALMPCNHFVLCDQCAKTARECPCCQSAIVPQA